MFLGIVARVKLRQPSRSNQTRDDFGIGEPVAPPRVKRHASVMVPRHSMIETGSSQLSAWASNSHKFVSILIFAASLKFFSTQNIYLYIFFQMDGSGWNGTLGVDLDAIAASMQKQKGNFFFTIFLLIIYLFFLIFKTNLLQVKR